MSYMVSGPSLCRDGGPREGYGLEEALICPAMHRFCIGCRGCAVGSLVPRLRAACAGGASLCSAKASSSRNLPAPLCTPSQLFLPWGLTPSCRCSQLLFISLVCINGVLIGVQADHGNNRACPPPPHSTPVLPSHSLACLCTQLRDGTHHHVSPHQCLSPLSQSNSDGKSARFAS